MWGFDRLKLRSKLEILAGVPVLGVLILSMLIVRDARQRAATAVALGSIQDLAELTARMADVSHEVQMERAHTALTTGLDNEPTAETALVSQRERTDAALAGLERFLASRDVNRFPPRLARGLTAALEKLRQREAFRNDARGKAFRVDRALDYYGAINEALIGATAALNQLSDDGELLRSISSLVATMEVKERGSREHALLANVFASGEYPPGMYRYYVTLVTQEAVYADALRNAATDEQYRLYEATQKEPAAVNAAAMRKVALETTDDAFEIDPRKWFEADAAKMESLRRVERDLTIRVERAATEKQIETRHAVRLSGALVGIIVVSSLLLALIIARGISRSVRGLVDAAARVRRDRDYSVRAPKLTRDELGILTDAFNEMLSGIQERDRELEDHRRNLESLVAERTKELSRRNEDMRVVLDNVDQGLVTLDRDGLLSSEKSEAFVRWFGNPDSKDFATVLAGSDERLTLTLRMGYEQIMSEILPIEVALDQVPRRIVRDGSHFSLALKPLYQDGQLDGALLIVTDITAELLARAAEAAQREQIKLFEHAMKDRAGFVEFFQESRLLVEKIRDDHFADSTERLRTVHTVKGNTSLYDVTSVADIAHRLEQAFLDTDMVAAKNETERLLEAWDAFASRVVPIVGEDYGERLEVPLAEVDAIIDAARHGRPHVELERMLQRVRREPIRLRFDRIAAQLVSVSRRFGKGTPDVVVQTNDVRLPIGYYGRFWSAFAHVVRNVVDHGFDTEEGRRAAGKQEHNRVDLVARYEGENIVIEISDDGRGIDWEKVARVAKERGLRADTQADRTRALFAPGVSTADHVTANSGRGVGMTEVAEACKALGGRIGVESELGKGTKFRFTLPGAPSGVSQIPRLSNAPLSFRPKRDSTV